MMPFITDHSVLFSLLYALIYQQEAAFEVCQLANNSTSFPVISEAVKNQRCQFTNLLGCERPKQLPEFADVCCEGYVSVKNDHL